MKARRIVFTLLIVVLSITIFSSCKEKTTEPAWNTVATPMFDPPGGTYNGSEAVTIACETLGVTIYYTLDGSNPNSASPVYSSPITISQTLTIKAKAFRDGWSDSSTASTVYTIVNPNFVHVPGGTFYNGISNVTVSSFYMDKYETTQAEYEAVMGVNPSYSPSVTNGPVEQVSWYNAIEYSNRRSMAEGLTPCYSYSSYGTDPGEWPAGWNSYNNNHSNVSCNWTANGYRLPTEMEWMFAAKGGNQSHGYTYSGSNTIGDVAWYYSNSDSRTHTVGTKAANELGIFDMSGNVWEWNWDIYGNNYPSGSQTNPTGANSGSVRVLRGGSWYNSADYCTVSYRADTVATVSDSDIGFRCVRVSF